MTTDSENINETKAWADEAPASSCQLGVNDAGTAAICDTPTAQSCSAPVPRKKFADHSRKGVWGYTYFVRCRDRIKIGHTALPHLRFPALVRELGGRIEVLAVIQNELVTEGTAHARFGHLRVEGELFQIAPDLLEFISDMKAAADRIPKREPARPRPKNVNGPLYQQLDSAQRRERDPARKMALCIRMAMEVNGVPDKYKTQQDAILARKPRVRVRAVSQTK